jgi:hypothetical protein
MNRIPILALAALLGLCLPAPAQEKAPPPATAQAPKPVAEAPDPALLKAMRSRVFIIQHADPLALLRLINPLRSGVRGSDTSFSNEQGLKAISVRDFPENLAAIEGAVKQLDVPAAATPSTDVELQIQVLFASHRAIAEADLPQDLGPVLKSLRSTLGYRGYTLAASLSQRVRVSGDHNIAGRAEIDGSALGVGTAKEPHHFLLDWMLQRGIALQTPANGPATIALPRFQINLKDLSAQVNLASLDTGLTLKEGEHVVVGTSVVKDHGLIVVVSAKRVQ